MSAKSNLEQRIKEEGSAKSRATVEGEYVGSGLKKLGQWIGNAWDDVKKVAGDFLDGISYSTTGKSVQNHVDSAKERVNNALVNFDDYVEEKTGKDVQGHLDSLLGSDSPTTPQSGVAAKPIVYSDWSPAAQQFRMDQSTAYAEHMANTAHQREVADLRAAGLNPVLGAGSGASGVSGSVAGISSGKKGIDGDALVDVIGATAGLVTTLISKNPSLGYMVSNVVGKAGDAFDR